MNTKFAKYFFGHNVYVYTVHLLFWHILFWHFCSQISNTAESKSQSQSWVHQSVFMADINFMKSAQLIWCCLLQVCMWSKALTSLCHTHHDVEESALIVGTCDSDHLTCSKSKLIHTSEKLYQPLTGKVTGLSFLISFLDSCVAWGVWYVKI